MSTICVITATRAEYGLLYPLINKILQSEDMKLQLIVSGSHLQEEYGYTKKEILEDGIPIATEIKILSTNDATGISKSMGTAIIKFAVYLKEHRPDIAIILGDRYEMMAFAIPLINEKIPIAHLNGGEITEGALDDVYRHCLTKMSTLHFTNCESHRKRVIQLGEDPNRVFNVGDLCIDNILQETLLDEETLMRELSLSFRDRQLAIVTYHPVTMENDTVEQLEAMLCALQQFPTLFFLFTKANADNEGALVNCKIEQFVREHDNSMLVDSLGRKKFLSVLSYARIMIGNSSSGIYEAPFFHIPTVNIGNRQKGRLHGETVIDCNANCEEIKNAISLAISESFYQICLRSKNIYGEGNTAEKIIDIIREKIEQGISVKKKFYDL